MPDTTIDLAKVVSALGLEEGADLMAIPCEIETRGQPPDPSKFVPISVVNELMQTRREALNGAKDQEAETLVDAVLSEGTPTPQNARLGRRPLPSGPVGTKAGMGHKGLPLRDESVPSPRAGSPPASAARPFPFLHTPRSSGAIVPLVSRQTPSKPDLTTPPAAPPLSPKTAV